MTTTPDVLVVARLAEGRFGLEERLSTALELAEHEQSVPSPVREALLQDAAKYAECLRPQELVPLPLPREVWYLMTMAVAVLALQLAPPLSPPTSAATPPAPSMTVEELTATGSNVRRVAELVGRDAEKRNDPYLQAVARALEGLGADIEQERVSSHEVEEELARLVDHLAQAYGLEEWAGAATNLISLLTPADRVHVGEDATSGQAEPHVDGGQAAASERGMAGFAERNVADPHTTLEDLLARLEAEEERQQAGEAPIYNVEQLPPERQWSDSENPYLDSQTLAAIEREREIIARLRPELPMGGDMGGAGDGASVEAGAGSQPLFDQDGEEILPDWASDAEEFELPFDRESSRRIQVDMPPEAQFAAIGEAQSVEGGGWRRYKEAPIAADYLHMINRSTVSRYFSTKETSQ